MQAIMIVAHKNPDQVLELCKLLKKTFNVYVHFDSKCHLSDDNIEKFKNAGINIYSHYSVNWGSYNICKVELLLLREALKNKDNTYFHLISGQDWPTDNIKSIIHVIILSTVLPKVAPITPNVNAIVPLIKDAKNPTFILKLSPLIVL